MAKSLMESIMATNAMKVILAIKQNIFIAHQVNKPALQEVCKNTLTLTTPQEPLW